MTKSNLEQKVGNWYRIDPVKCDELIAQGQTSTDIAREFGVSHVAVLKYINRTDQYQSWVRKRKKITAKEMKDRAALREELDQQKRSEKERLLAERKKQEEQLEPRVLEAVREYLTTSPEALSEDTSIECKKIKKILSRNGISRRGHYARTIPIIVSADINLDQVILDTDSQKQKYAILKTVQKDKPVTIEQVRMKTGIEKETIKKVLREERFLLDLPSRDYRPEIDALISTRLTASEIARRLDLSKSAITHYARATGQSGLIRRYWKKDNRKIAPQKHLLETLVQRQYQLAEPEYGRYSSRALDISYQGKGLTRKLSFLGKLLRLARVYAEAEDQGKRLSYQELGDRSEFGSPSEVQKSLSQMRLKSMCWSWSIKHRTEVTSSQKEAIKNSYFTSFSMPDLGYFLDLPAHIIVQHFTALKKIRGKRERTKIYLQTLSNDGKGQQKGDHLNYRRASQVYELDDYAQRENASFSVEELSEGIGLNPKLVEYARKNRGRISEDIMHLLRILSPEKEVSKPYLDR